MVSHCVLLIVIVLTGVLLYWLVCYCIDWCVIVLTGVLLFLTFAMSTNWLTRIAIKW